MRELDRQQDSLLERLLCSLQARDIIPADIRPLLENRARQRAPQLLAILVQGLAAVSAVLPGFFPFARPARRPAVGAHHARFLLFGVRVCQVRFQLLGPVHVLARLGPDHLLGFRVLLPFEREHEQLEGLVVQLVGFVVLGGVVGLDGFAHLLDGAAEEVGVGHGCGEDVSRL